MVAGVSGPTQCYSGLAIYRKISGKLCSIQKSKQRICSILKMYVESCLQLDGNYIVKKMFTLNKILGETHS